MRDAALVVSFGDLLAPSGYRTRVLGELLHLERGAPLAPVLLAFDRQAGKLPLELPGNVEARVRPRRARLYYAEAAALARRRRIRLVHAHNLYSAALALSARRFFRYPVVLDLHGRIPEEYVYLGKGGGRARALLEALERRVVRSADHVVAVSRRLEQHLVRAHGIDPARITVIPCCADPSLFRLDPGARRDERARLGLEHRFVCVHLGSLFDWYAPEALLEAFHAVRAHRPEAHLLVVTRRAAEAGRWLAGRLAPGDYTALEAPHDEVPALLNASDLGLLLLAGAPNIETASPVKFAEYLNCGLPVLISERVGDCSDLVRETGAGQVLGAGGRIDPTLLDAIADSRPRLAAVCAEAGRRLAWPRYRDAWNAVLARLGDRGD